MISKKYRLGVKEFQKTITKGQGYNSKFFYLKILKNSKGQARVGVGVSKKLTKKAVKRNYYKRVLRHILKDVLGDSFDMIGCDIVFIGQEAMGKNKFDYLKKDAQDLLKKTKLI